MADALIFGFPEPNVHYTERPATYVVVVDDEQVAMVKSQRKYFLPGGGSLPGEASEATVVREVEEELARRVRLRRWIGDAKAVGLRRAPRRVIARINAAEMVRPSSVTEHLRQLLDDNK